MDVDDEFAFSEEPELAVAKPISGQNQQPNSASQLQLITSSAIQPENHDNAEEIISENESNDTKNTRKNNRSYET